MFLSIFRSSRLLFLSALYHMFSWFLILIVSQFLFSVYFFFLILALLLLAYIVGFYLDLPSTPCRLRTSVHSVVLLLFASNLTSFVSSFSWPLSSRHLVPFRTGMSLKCIHVLLRIPWIPRCWFLPFPRYISNS